MKKDVKVVQTLQISKTREKNVFNKYVIDDAAKV